ncbi:ComEC/Rec2 family competence protein [Abyssogena phaseoliformis symbiont]|uniref:ComEC/Rec2 family competence protein n=1 Tax=Abyssogena phaseoliformis symbiont TaxID=596095 RepID=UPI00191513A2|nr:ComEC/Rec2 family competence protein [Abyssogena phaseoliformis symbiont]
MNSGYFTNKFRQNIKQTLSKFLNKLQFGGVCLMRLLLVLVINPVSIFSVGFWLSFYVVAIIIYGTSQHKNRHWIVRLIYIQLLISITTMPLVTWFFNSGSILSPIANLVAIPIFSFISTPFALIGAIFAHLQLSWLATLSFDIANQSLIILSILLEYLQSLNFNQWYYTQASSVEMLLLIIAILPSALKLRKIALVLLLLIVFHPFEKITKGSAVVTMLDVGQGLANVIHTQNHTLLFDTGSGVTLLDLTWVMRSSFLTCAQNKFNIWIKLKQPQPCAKKDSIGFGMMCCLKYSILMIISKAIMPHVF